MTELAIENKMVEQIKSSGSHSWECQRSHDSQIQTLIENGLWFDRIEQDPWGGENLVVVELYGQSEMSLNTIGELVYVEHKTKVTILKFKLK